MRIYYSRNLKKFAQEMRNHPTRAESVLWNKLKKMRLAYDFHRQKSFGPYIFDFYCYKLKLLIEVDGATHDLPKVAENDRLKDLFATENGFRLIRLTDDEVLYGEDFAESKIKECIKEIEFYTPPTPPS